jgi:hypothetical protein
VLPDGPDLPEAAYVHRRDDDDPRHNKGLGQLWLGIDLVVAPDPLNPREPGPPEELPPVPPRLDTPLLAFGTALAPQAVRARTGVGAPLGGNAAIEAPPAVDFQGPVLPPGAAARLTVRASRPTDLYTLRIAGRDVSGPQAGTGSDLVLTSPALAGDTILELGVVDTAAAPIAVERVLRRAVAVLPRNDLPFHAEPATVAGGGDSTVVLESSERGVAYQLVAAGQPLGDAVPGTGGALSLPTGPLAATTVLRIRAARRPPPGIAAAEVEAMLDGAVTVTVGG